MSTTLVEFLETDLAKAAIAKGTEDGLAARRAGQGIEVEAAYRTRLQVQADKHRKIDIWMLYAMAATQQSSAFLHELLS